MDDSWYFIHSKAHTPAYNMALDECLLDWHSKGEIPPVLRFYTWEPAGVSLGYFQQIDGKIHTENIQKYGFDLVRRLTGGRAVLHDQELTYSIIISEDHPFMPASVTEAYKVISQGLLEGYRLLGLEAELAIPEGELNQTGSAVCFDEPSWYELVIGDLKAAGSAQTRQRGVILQHGSVPVSTNVDELFDMFVYPNEDTKNRAKEVFKKKATSIEQALGRKPDIREIEKAFYHGFEKGLKVELEPYQLTDEQTEEVEKLAREKYSSDQWNYKR
ncbi:lipoate--protein ligase family protein [Halalkalibacillus halophilus]|uniref:lipoate--protein ligase family protein n=1 Tax=Halalkalibacillus halophilus TaxID=392827 RepID=UPI000425541D|nr:biotin/lipoate A/B protein ligase family protein [Halalkalibacillus halophilus]